MIEQFKAGDIPAARFQAFRVPQAIYEQRENGTYKDADALFAALRQKLGDTPLLQFGGHASVGRGLTRVIL